MIFGLSGGLDSAVTAVLAASALGGESVYAVSLPSYCTSDLSKSLAGQLARNLGINLEEVAVKPVLDGMKHAVGHIVSHLKDITEQKLQSRLRANILFTLGGEYGAMPISTDDLSELSVAAACCTAIRPAACCLLGTCLKRNCMTWPPISIKPGKLSPRVL